MFTSIGADNINSEVLEEKVPVLLALINHAYEYKAQIEILNSVSKIFGKKLKVCLLDEDEIGIFMKFGVDGSPAYLIFSKGKEKGKMLGKAEILTLKNFILTVLPEIKKG